MPRRGPDKGVTMPFPIRTHAENRGDNPAISTGPGSKIQFEEELYRQNVRMRLDDFTDFTPGTVLSTTTGWSDRTSGTPTTHAVQANTANGVYQGVLASTNEVEAVGVDWADQLLVPATRRWMMEASLSLGVTITTAMSLVVGMGTAYNSTLASISKYARIRLNASMVPVIDSKDGTTTANGTSLVGTHGAITLTTSQNYLFTVDATKAGTIRYFIDNTQIFSQSIGAFAVTDLLQPMVYLHKASGAGIPSILIDWIRVSWNRTGS